MSGAASVGIEEPEAHLHAPTTGRTLRQLLQQLVEEPSIPVQQLFIATHSNLFDLDSSGYFDVRLDGDGSTQVRRQPLSELYGQHLYEPGPARSALVEMLDYIDPDKPVFVAQGGRRITAGDMIALLDQTAHRAT